MPNSSFIVQIPALHHSVPHLLLDSCLWSNQYNSMYGSDGVGVCSFLFNANSCGICDSCARGQSSRLMLDLTQPELAFSAWRVNCCPMHLPLSESGIPTRHIINNHPTIFGVQCVFLLLQLCEVQNLSESLS